MNAWKLPSVLAALVLAACSGGGSAGTASSPASAPLVPSASKAIATGTLSILPAGAGTSASNVRRRPAYISTGTTYATLFIDGATSGAGVIRQACSTAAPCEFTWSSSSGQHTFSVETDSSQAENCLMFGQGFLLGCTPNLLSEGSQTYTLQAGDNGALPPMSLDGVIAQIALVSESIGQCPNETGTNCFSGSLSIADASGNIITSPGNFTAVWIPEPPNIDPADLSGTFNGPSNALGTGYPFAMSCNFLDVNGTFTLSPVNFGGQQNPYISSDDLALYGLQVPPVVVTGFPEYQCLNGAISAIGPANGSLTVQSTH